MKQLALTDLWNPKKGSVNPPEPETHTVTFNSNGGSAVISQTVIDGDTASEPQVPTKAGYIFDCWCSDAELTTEYDFNDPVVSDITLYAKWESEPETYTVTFNSNGGSAVSSQTVTDGDTATEPQAPTKEDYSFDCWCSDAELTTEYDFNDPVTSDITLYAKWEAEIV